MSIAQHPAGCHQLCAGCYQPCELAAEAVQLCLHSALSAVARFVCWQALRDVFDSLDQNGNGVLDHDECRELCGKIGLIYSNEKFDHMMKKLDPDGDSQVNHCLLTWPLLLCH